MDKESNPSIEERKRFIRHILIAHQHNVWLS